MKARIKVEEASQHDTYVAIFVTTKSGLVRRICIDVDPERHPNGELRVYRNNEDESFIRGHLT